MIRNNYFLEKIEDSGRRYPKNGEIIWRCKCLGGFPTCKGETFVTTSDFKVIKSCGCFAKKHEYRGTLTYRSWQMMKYRCYTKSSPDYNNWGGRGISVCERWLDKDMGFINFLEDMGERPSKHYTLDRKDNNGNYSSDNCCWSEAKDQIRNSRVAKLTVEKVKNIKDMIKEGVPHKIIAERYNCCTSNISAISCGRSWVDIK